MSRENRNAPRQGGFTLVEIMVVVVIIGLLAGLVGPAVIGRQADAQIDVAKSDIAAIYSAAELYMQRNRLQVPEMEDLMGEDSHGQPWIKASNIKDGELLDPWGNAYEIVPMDGLKFDVVSWGPDGEEDSEDDITYLNHDE